MLRELRIRNFAIIDELAVGFEPGLNILTGETGAGKSIIVDALGVALGVALGGKAASGQIRTGCDSAVVEVLFENARPGLLEKAGIETGDSIVLRRIIPAASGAKSRAYINDSMVSLQTLNEAGRELVDIHGQHEHQSLLLPDKQLKLLDEQAGLSAQKEAYRALFEETRATEQRLAALGETLRERANRQDMLAFQIAEIEAAGLSPGEEERLEEERGVLTNVTKLRELMESAYLHLYAREGAAHEGISRALASLEALASIDPQAAAPLELLRSAKPLVEEAALFVRSNREKYAPDPERLTLVEQRLELIGRLRKKYGGGTVAGILDYLERAGSEMKSLLTTEEDQSALEAELAKKKDALSALARGLSEKRRKAAASIEKAVTLILQGLALEKAEFRIGIEEIQPGPQGADKVEFLFNANPGESMRPLAKVASGGELSRLMLALKSTAKGRDVPVVLVFDEVDAGVGGITAENVARRLRELSKTHQILCITHLPQIASAADTHLLVEKDIQTDRVKVGIRRLEGTERHEEIARMLSGKPSAVSLRHAKELIERSIAL